MRIYLLFSLKLPLYISIVEAYTFNFQVNYIIPSSIYTFLIQLSSTQYHTIPGTDTTIPIMTLGEQKKGGPRDPVTEAGKKGQAPTLRDVKKSVKVCGHLTLNLLCSNYVVLLDAPQDAHKFHHSYGQLTS